MLTGTGGQWRVFLVMTAAGGLMGAVYDVLAFFRRRMEAGLPLSLVCDLLFGGAAAGIYIAFSLAACMGEIRLYALLGCFLGGCLYRAGIRPRLRRLQKRLPDRQYLLKTRKFIAK